MNFQSLKPIHLFAGFVLWFLPWVVEAADSGAGDTLQPTLAVPVFDTLDAFAPPDTLLLPLADSSSITADSTAIDSTALRRASSLEAPVFSDARDSIIYDFTGEHRMIYYYGDITVTYANTEMKSEYMAYDTDTRIVFAAGVPDSTGKLIGRPVMKEDGKEYQMETVHYNFGSRKAKINNVITAEGEAYLHGEAIKKMPDNSIHVHHGKYTTCDAEHPHFYLSLTRAKVTPEPNSRTVFGPAYLVIEDVPTPLALPFGFIPKRSDRAGGFLFPTFGEEPSRGFYLNRIGWYFVFGEYFDMALTADYFTLGSWALRADSRYKKLYKFDGSFSFNISENVSGAAGSTDYSSSRNFAVSWSHRQDPKANPELTLSASVNYMSSSYRRYNSMTNPQNALQSTAQSSISLSKRWEGSPFNLSINLTHSQNMQDSSYALTLPNLTLTMSTIYPFKRKRGVGGERVYEKISFSYNTNFDNKIRFKESELGTPDFWRKLENGMKHNFSIGLPSFNVLKHINVSPSVSYGMTMFFQSLQKSWSDSTGRVEDIKSQSFSEFHMAHSYSFGASLSTRIYGTFQAGRNAFIQAFRHVITPSVSLSYSPDLRTPWNGHRTYYYTDRQGMAHALAYNMYSGLYGAPGGGQAASLGFTLGNNFEMKVRNKKDTVNGVSKIKLIDNLNFSGSYNFLADSMNLSNINASLSTNILGVGISANAVFDPYAVQNGQRTAKFNIADGGGLARLTSFGFSGGYQFKGGENGLKNYATTLEGIPRFDPATGDYLYTEYLFYDDFKAPWSFGFNYSFNYSVSYPQGKKEGRTMQSLNFNGQIKLTEALNISAQSGFDFKQMQLTTTTISMHYDLHCFDFDIQWTPFGQYQSWSFLFKAKSAMLYDLLKYDKKTNYYIR
ncbi:MAG: LPS-assembly protein LptD [Prevotellaceae bacterium]|nr:LPS-assembly protein LptD [Prevotellaceae bacterium]